MNNQLWFEICFDSDAHFERVRTVLREVMTTNTPYKHEIKSLLDQLTLDDEEAGEEDN